MELINIRASSLAELFDCPARWEAKQIKGLRLACRSVTQIGTAFHGASAVYDSSRLHGGNPMTVDDALGVLADSIWRPEQDVVWDADLQQREAEKIGSGMLVNYCERIAPSREYVAVEAKCERLEIPDLGIALTGQNDRIRKVGNRHGISDLKTGKTAVGTDGIAKTAGHGPQLGVYELLAEYSMGISIDLPAEIIGAQTAKKEQRVGTAEIPNAREMLTGTPEQPGMLQAASMIIKSGVFFPNPRSMLCSKDWCPAWDTCKAHG